MSRALPVAERALLDFYATPDALALAICELIEGDGPAPRVVVEPSAGHGPFVRAARSTWPEAFITAVDIAPERMPLLSECGADVVETLDWLDFVKTQRGEESPLLILGNPPYRDAEEHVRAALAWMRDGDALVFLLRLNLLGSRTRVPFWRETPLAWVAPLVPRPSFTQGGTDATEYAAFCWRKGYVGHAALWPPLLWKPERASDEQELPDGALPGQIRLFGDAL